MDESEAVRGLLDLIFDLEVSNLDSSILNSAENQNTDIDVKTESELALKPKIKPESKNKPEEFEFITQKSNQNLIANEQNLPEKIETKSPESENQNIEDPQKPAMNSLQKIFLELDLQSLRATVRKLEQQIYNPEELIELIVPVIIDILKIKESQSEVTHLIAPVIDDIISINIQQDQAKMSSALAPVMPQAIAQNIMNTPGEFANVIAPEMGIAIQEQLRINKSVMIDALYPIIGSTIAKYFAEAIKSINEKIENTFSKEGIRRKIRAKLQGVSESELIFAESIPVIVRAIFLIHKASGLIICEVQNPDAAQILESEMMAGMLTAIRSFANDCFANPEFDVELSEIDYGSCKIMLEVAGYCYMATVIDGAKTPDLINKIRKTLEAIVSSHSKVIQNFDGDMAAVSPRIRSRIEQVFIKPAAPKISKPKTIITKKSRLTFWLLLFLMVLGFFGGVMIRRQQLSLENSQQIYQLQNQIILALEKNPELSLYKIAVEINQNGQVELRGMVPQSYLRDLATKIANAQIQSEIATNSSTNSSVNSSVNSSTSSSQNPSVSPIKNPDLKDKSKIDKSKNNQIPQNPNKTPSQAALNSTKINNQIVVVANPPTFAAAEVKRVTTLLNRLDGIKISAVFSQNRTTITGTASKPKDLQTISAAFAQIPGIAGVENRVHIVLPPIATRIYFEFNSTEILESEFSKILQIKFIMEQNPSYQLKIIGHSDEIGDSQNNQRIALGRAQVVKAAIVRAGILATRLVVESSDYKKPETKAKTNLNNPGNNPELNRYAEFEMNLK